MKKRTIFMLSSVFLLSSISFTSLTSCGDVTEKEEKFVISSSVNDETLGSVSLSKTTGVVGEKVTFTITLNQDKNVEIESILINNQKVDSTTREFSPRVGSNSLVVNFKEISEEVKTGTVVIDTTIEHGSVSANKLSGNVGDVITLTVTPEENYELETLKLNEEALEVKENKATFKLLEGENKITATFKVKEIIDPTPVTKKADFYFSDLTGWNFYGSSAFVHVFDKNGDVTTWPGKELTWVNYGGAGEGRNIYKVENLEYNDTSSIVFSTGSYNAETKEYTLTGKTSDLSLNNKDSNFYFQLTSEETVDGTKIGKGEWKDWASFENSIKATVEISKDIVNGVVTADKTSGLKGDTCNLVVTPNEGYEIESVLLNGKALTPSEGNYSFALESGNNLISATFKKTETTPDPVTKIKTFYFSDLNGWNNMDTNAYIYLFGANDYTNAAWPGEKMEFVNYGGAGEGRNIYRLADVDYSKATNAIFSIQNSDGTFTKQTVDIDLTTLKENEDFYFLNEEIEGKGQGEWKNWATYEETIKGNVTLLPTVNGKVEASKLTGYVGDQITLTLTPDTGYTVDTVLVNDVKINKSGTDYKFNLVAGNNNVQVTFKEEIVTPNEIEIYLRTPHWWKKDGASTNIKTFGESLDTPLNGDLDEEMTYVSYNATGDFNYYKATIDLNEVKHLKFIRTGLNNEKVLTHWGAESVTYDLTNLGDNDLFIIEDNEKWAGNGEYAELTTSKYDPSKDPGTEDYGVYNIYLDLNNVWSSETVYMHAWGNSGDNGGWPGVKMTKEGNYFVSTLDTGKYNKLIFNLGNGAAQTGNLSINFKDFGNNASIKGTLNSDLSVTWTSYVA